MLCQAHSHSERQSLHRAETSTTATEATARAHTPATPCFSDYKWTRGIGSQPLRRHTSKKWCPSLSHHPSPPPPEAFPLRGHTAVLHDAMTLARGGSRPAYAGHLQRTPLNGGSREEIHNTPDRPYGQAHRSCAQPEASTTGDCLSTTRVTALVVSSNFDLMAAGLWRPKQPFSR